VEPTASGPAARLANGAQCWYALGVMSAGRDTVAALSTPPGESGIAVVRMTGPDAVDILRGVFRTPSGTEPKDGWEHRRLYHGRIVDGKEEPLDDVMCAVMRAPDTYTGEDVVEISCHGGSVVVAAILGALHARGARPAGPGEFTRRAFLNGKMDLIQAEAVADLIHARSELQRRVAHEQLAGGLSRRIEALADQILELQGIIEANIDFIEEDIDMLDRDGALALLEEQRDELDDLLSSAALSKPFREGFRVAIAGPVNAGKSSLFNRLVGERRAIVTDIPGTTRDVLREPQIFEGLVFMFHDTAGMRGERGDAVESIGMDLANEAVRAADLVLFVVDASQPVSDLLVEKTRELNRANALIVLNKIDLPASGAEGTLQELHPEGSFVRVSAATGEGIDRLRREIVRGVAGDELSRIARERVVLNRRLVSLLEDGRERVDALAEAIETHNNLEIISLEARGLLGLYEDATGRRYQPRLLDAIFSRFCIGK
jgi:tRNA modification GTPase